MRVAALYFTLVYEAVRRLLPGQVECVESACFVYDCPTSRQRECLQHGGFDVCCSDPTCPAYGRRR